MRFPEKMIALLHFIICLKMNKYWKKSESNIYHDIWLTSFQIGVEQNGKVQVYDIFTQSL